MKIAQVCQYFYPYLAGQERYVLQLSKKLLQNEEDLEVFTIDYSNLLHTEIIEGIHVNRFDMIFAPLNNPISLDFLKALKKLKSFDVIHVHNEHSFVSFICCLYSIIYKKSIILTCHGQLRFGSPLIDLFEKAYSKTIGKFIFNSAKRIVVLSEDDFKYVCNLGVNKNKISILPNAIDIDYLKKINENIAANSKLNNKFNDEKIILYVGRIIPRKGIEYLIKSIPNVVNQSKDAIFVLIGEGDYKKEAQELCYELGISDKVLFLSNLSEEMLFEYYKRADIFILPSLSEGLPTTILEAMYFNTPVITTNIPGVRNHFKDIAILVPPKNEEEIAKNINKLLYNESLKNSMIKKGKMHVLNNYNWDKVSKNYLDLYFNLLR